MSDNTTAPRQRLVRRAPFMERVKAFLDPLDFLLWLSEELNSNDWEDFLRQWAYPGGLVLNVLFMTARSNSGWTSSADSDIFSDSYEPQSAGWLAWLATCVVWLLSLLAVANAFYTFWRRRHYRLFEANIDMKPSTPSAQRVRVDSSPFASTPLKFLQDNIFSSAQARAHPDPTRDVWEVHVWDPTPLCLRLFCLFSPGHVLVYNLFLPLNPLDSRPSVTIATTVFLAFLISSQLLLLQFSFSQQIKDTAIIHKEVQNEYDAKFVRPIIYHPVRDAGTQMLGGNTPTKTHEVLVSTPKTFVNRGFKPNPNTNYAKHYDPDSYNSSEATAQRFSRSISSPAMQTSGYTASDLSSPTKSNGPRHNDSGHLGIYSHAQSPLRKSVAIQSTPRSQATTSGRRPGLDVSPQKRVSTPANNTPSAGSRLTQLRGPGERRDSYRS